MAKTLRTGLKTTSGKRKRRRDDWDQVVEEGWRKVDPKKDCFSIQEFDTISTAFAIFKKRYVQHTFKRLDIFIQFITPELVQCVLKDLPQDSWAFKADRHIPMKTANVFQYLALYIRILGLQDPPTRTHRTGRPLRDHIDQAIEHFRTRHQRQKVVLNSAYTEFFFTHFNFTSKYYEALSSNYQSILRTIGRFVSGNEKVFAFTGRHCFVLKVPGKGSTGEMGLWIYQLVCVLSNGKSFMIHCGLKDAIKSRGQIHPVVDAVANWIDIVERFRPSLPNPEAETITCIDSHYYSKNTTELCTTNPHFKFIIATTENKLDLCEFLKQRVHRQGNWSAMYNADKNQILTHYYNNNNNFL